MVGMTGNIFSITKLNAFIKKTLDREYLLKSFYVEGTISNAKRHSNGHFYFTLKDEESSIDVTMWNSVAIQKGLTKSVENGLFVTMKASVNFYSKTGRLNIICQDMQVGQKSPIQIEFEALKRELTSLGYFDEDHKLDLPQMPSCIGIVTSESGAILHDILHVSKQRNPLVTFKLFSVPVQGNKAAPMIAKGIEKADQDKDVELIIVGRGGGAMEDLWCFNERPVVEAVYFCKTPIISAVGHETDFTLCDFAADVRGATPSHAAELAVYPLLQLEKELQELEKNLNTLVKQTVNQKKQELSAIFNRKLGIPALQCIHQEAQELQNLQSRLIVSSNQIIDNYKNSLALLAHRLELLNPLQLMVKGYSKIEVNQKMINSVKQVEKGDTLSIRLQDGSINAKVEEIINNGHIS